MKIVTICGSMKFAKEMKEIAWELEAKEGYCVIQCVYNEYDEESTAKQIKNLNNAHFKKIDLADAIYVVNIDNYIGKQTTAEIQYARLKGKEIIYHQK